MKPLSVTAVSITALAVASFSLPAVADTATTPGSTVEVEGGAGLGSDSAVMDLARKDPAVLKGQEVVTYNGDSVGKIDRVMQDPRDETIYAVIDADDFFDEDVNDVLVPVGELSLHSEDTLMMSQDMELRLKEMVFDEESLETLSD